MRICDLPWLHGQSDLKPIATWEVDGTGLTTGVPVSMYLLSGNILFVRF